MLAARLRSEAQLRGYEPGKLAAWRRRRMGHTKFFETWTFNRPAPGAFLQVKWQKPVKNLNGASEYIKA